MHREASELARLLTLGSANVHEAVGRLGAMDSAIKPIHPTMRVVGPARTVACPPGDNLMIHYAVDGSRPGEVLVVDFGGDLEAGPWGDLLTLYAVQKGLAGLVIDGCVRDTEGIVELGLPTFSRGVSIKGTDKVRLGKHDVPIVCGGVTVRPGDIVVADADGVVVVADHDLDRVLLAAEQRARSEDRMRSQILAGASLAELLGLDERFRELGLAPHARVDDRDEAASQT